MVFAVHVSIVCEFTELKRCRKNLRLAAEKPEITETKPESQFLRNRQIYSEILRQNEYASDRTSRNRDYFLWRENYFAAHASTSLRVSSAGIPSASQFPLCSRALWMPASNSTSRAISGNDIFSGRLRTNSMTVSWLLTLEPSIFTEKMQAQRVRTPARRAPLLRFCSFQDRKRFQDDAFLANHYRHYSYAGSQSKNVSRWLPGVKKYALCVDIKPFYVCFLARLDD